MFTTGLVSLGIHEALTFDGIEIALHPDLFCDPGASGRHNIVGRSTGSATVTSITSSATNTLQKPHHLRSNSDLIAPDDLKADDGRPPILNTASFSTAPSLSNRRLEVGDMIEIRVWDPLPGSEKTSPQALKRRSPPASKDGGASASTSVTNDGPILRRVSSTSATLEAAASSLQDSTPLSSSGSLQYSLDSSFPPLDKKEEQPKEGDSSTVSSIERAKDTVQLISNPPSPKGDIHATEPESSTDNRGGIPPTFPRNRADTADGAARLLASKPPPSHRSRTALSVSNDAPEPRRRNLSLVQNSAKPTGAHVRDISDMTMDTVLGSHLPDLGVYDTAAEEDDTLSQISSTHSLRLSFVMLVTEKTLTSLKESARTQVSMLRQGMITFSLLCNFLPCSHDGLHHSVFSCGFVQSEIWRYGYRQSD